MKNIYKLGLMVVAVAFTQTAVAKGPGTTWCGYSDYFHTTSSAPANFQIRSISSDSNVAAAKTSSTSFMVSDTADCPPDGGYAKVRYGIDAANGCDLTIHDSATMWDPEIVAHCQGSVQYNGITYDGIGSYTYSLLFSS